MGTRSRRFVFVVIACALAAAACGSDPDPAPASTESASSGASTSTLDVADLVAPGDQTGVVNDCVADDNGTDAADTFDEAGLDLDPADRRRFEPLNDPVMVTAGEVTWLDPDDIVMGILHNGEAQAFPVSQMVYHHIANTSVAGEPYLVTY